MDYALRVRGDSGAVQIDGQYANFAVLASGTTTPSAKWTSLGTGYYVDLSITVASSAVVPQLAIQGLDGVSWYFLFQTSVSGNTWTWRVIGTRGDSSGSVGAFKYWILGRGAASASSGYGLRVRDAAGNITYDSGNRHARVVGVVNTTYDGLTSSGPQTYSFSEPVCYMHGSYGFQISVHAFPPIPSQFAWAYNVATVTNAGANALQAASFINLGFDEPVNSPLSGGGTRQPVSGLILAANDLG